MRGRKPKPTALRVLQGNPGRRPLNDREPVPPALPPGAPEELAGNTLALEEWARTIEPAIAIGQITTADRGMAIAHCELWAAWREQVALTAKAKHVTRRRNGHDALNPIRAVANKTLLLLHKIDAELGLTPTSRSRVHVANRSPAGAENPLNKFMRGV